MQSLHIPRRWLTDARAQALRAAGWIIKAPYFVHGHAVFPAQKRS